MRRVVPMVLGFLKFQNSILSTVQLYIKEICDDFIVLNTCESLMAVYIRTYNGF